MTEDLENNQPTTLRTQVDVHKEWKDKYVQLRTEKTRFKLS